MTYEDGSRETFGTDGDWRCARGPVVAASLYDGERYDARRELPGWSSPGFDAAGWAPVEAVAYDAGQLVAPTGPPVRRTQLVDPVATFASPSGKTIVDFGQNLVGRLRIRAHGSTAGRPSSCATPRCWRTASCASARCAAPAQPTSTRCAAAGSRSGSRASRSTASATRRSRLAGRGRVGSRAVVCHTDMERTGWFACSEPDLDRLHANVVWGMRGNFLDVPTDCPQRDERLGWTGDAQVFAPTASFLYDCAGMLTSWLRDVAAEQRGDGVVPIYVPFVALRMPEVPEDQLGGPMAAWGDAAVIVPWVLYERFGDREILAAQFASMQAWVDGVVERTGDALLWDEGMQLGDWLDPAAPPDQPWAAATDPHLVATAYLARSADLLSRAAGVLGLEPEAQLYSGLAGGVRHAFAQAVRRGRARIADRAARSRSSSRCCPRPEQRAAPGGGSPSSSQSAGHRIATGFVGTPLVCDALAARRRARRRLPPAAAARVPVLAVLR